MKYLSFIIVACSFLLTDTALGKNGTDATQALWVNVPGEEQIFIDKNSVKHFSDHVIHLAEREGRSLPDTLVDVRINGMTSRNIGFWCRQRTAHLGTAIVGEFSEREPSEKYDKQFSVPMNAVKKFVCRLR